MDSSIGTNNSTLFNVLILKLFINQYESVLVHLFIISIFFSAQDIHPLSHSRNNKVTALELLWRGWWRKPS